MYRKLVEHHKETIGAGGAWNSFATLGKESDRKSAYCDYVVLNYILDDRTAVSSTDSTDLLEADIGLMFAASHNDALTTVDGDANQLGTDYVISVNATNGYGGRITLPIKQVIKGNATDLTEMDGKITLWMKATDVTIDDTLVWRFYIESYGRWHTCNGL